MQKPFFKYDAELKEGELPEAQAHIRRFIDANDICGRSVAEFGCGTGGVTLWAAMRYPERIWGYDENACFIERAEAYARIFTAKYEMATPHFTALPDFLFTGRETNIIRRRFWKKAEDLAKFAKDFQDNFVPWGSDRPLRCVIYLEGVEPLAHFVDIGWHVERNVGDLYCISRRVPARDHTVRRKASVASLKPATA